MLFCKASDKPRVGTEPTGLPHSMQNLAPSTTGVLHVLHLSVNFEPHSAQNFASEGLDLLHSGHFMARHNIMNAGKGDIYKSVH